MEHKKSVINDAFHYYTQQSTCYKGFIVELKKNLLQFKFHPRYDTQALMHHLNIIKILAHDLPFLVPTLLLVQNISDFLR